MTIDFETGPPLNTPINDEYLAGQFTRFLRADLGFRPYRRSVGAATAHSGSVVADVGFDVCPGEVDPQSCEFPGAGTVGRLSRAAKSVSVYAGLFRPLSDRPVTARLVAFRADDTEAAASPAVPVSAAGFTAAVTASSAAADIVRFSLQAEGPGAIGGSTLGFDDLTLTFPDVALPDFSLAVVGDDPTVLQGSSTDLPIILTRIGGSNGPVELSVAGLPTGVDATFTPNPVAGGEEEATLHLSATDTAAPSVSLAQVTLTADPQGNGSVAPASRSVTVGLRVGSNYELSAAAEPVLLGQCAPADAVVQLARDRAFTGTVTLTAENVPAGVTAAFYVPTGVSGVFVPGDTIGPGGGFGIEARLRLRRQTSPVSGQILVRASSPGVPDRTANVSVGSLAPSAALTSTLGTAPMLHNPGSQRALAGTGFCVGTRLEVGNSEAAVDTAVDPDRPTLLTFRVPRTATTGPVRVLPPGGSASYLTTNSLDVKTFRNHYGFQFDNYPFEHLSFDELTDLVGVGEMFVHINPCWPWGSCRIPTGVPDPRAFIMWGVAEIALRESGGHCFGISRTIQELTTGRAHYGGDLGTTATRPFDVPSPSGPAGSVKPWLDARHAGQLTAEFLDAWLARDKHVSAQLARVRSELDAGRFPGIAIRKGFSGHVVTAYDTETRADGGVNIYVYDNNRPFVPALELSNPLGHRRLEVEESVIRIAPGLGRWEFTQSNSVWSGGNDGSLFTIPVSVIPDDPSLSVSVAAVAGIEVLFGSPGGAARTTGPPPGADWLPVLDSHAIPGAAGSLVAPATLGSLTHTVKGVANGSYTHAIAGAGFAAAIQGVRTGAGVTDKLTASPKERRVRFAGQRERPLALDLATALGAATTRAATVRTRTFKGGSDDVALRGGSALVYVHRGKATSFSFELSDLSSRRGVSRFSSGPVRIADGDTVIATPKNWTSLGTVELDVRSARGGRSKRTLANQARPSSVTVTVQRPRLRDTNKGPTMVLSTRFRHVPEHSVAGVVLRVVRAGRTVARKAFSVSPLMTGARTDRWRLPKLEPGAYRVVANVHAVTVAAQATSRTVTRHAMIRVR